MADDLHDGGEERENDTRRDDGLEAHQQRASNVIDREFSRGSDYYNELSALRIEAARRSLDRDTEMFNDRQKLHAELQDRRLAQLGKLDNLEARRRERAEVQSDDRGGLEFRDAAKHSTSIGALESEEVAATNALVGETAVVGAQDQEDTTDADDVNTGVAEKGA